MKLKNKTKNFKSAIKKVDPISFALVMLLGASATFAGWQLMQNDPTTVSLPGGNDGDHLPVVGEGNDPRVAELLEEMMINPIEGEDFELTLQVFNPETELAEGDAPSIFFYPAGSVKNSYSSRGMSFQGADNEVVNVVSTLSGTVSSVVHDEIIRGTIVTIDHANGVQTVYTGVYNVAVEVGTEVSQGDIIGVTGLSQREPEAGNVVHFEVMHNGVHINPEDVIGQQLGDL